MRLRRIHVRHLPGIHAPFRVEGLSPSISVLLGPNGSGKTSLCRAIRSSLWPERTTRRLEVFTEWEVDSRRWTATAEPGGVRWQRADASVGDDERPTCIPDAHAAGCFTLGLRDLLLEDAATDRQIARSIRLLMAGGFDLGAAEESHFKIGRRHGKKEADALAARERELKTVQEEQKHLAAEEHELETLRRELEQSRRARDARVDLGRAAELAQKREALQAVRERLEALEPAVILLRGDEVERRDEIRREREAIDAAIADLHHRREQAEAILSEKALPQGPLPESTLRTWKGRAQDLQQIERDLGVAREREAKARAALDDARAALFSIGADEPAPEITATSLDGLDAWLRAAEYHRQQRAAIDERLSLLEEAGERSEAEDVSRGIDALRDWLASPPPEAARAAHGWIVLIGSAAALLAGLVLAVLHDPWWAALAGAGAALLSAAALRGQDGDDRRALHRERFQSLELEPPSYWAVEAVKARLRELERQHRECELARDRAAERQRLEGKMRSLEAQEEQHHAERERLRTALGLGPAASDLRLTQVAALVKRWRKVVEDLATATTAREEMERVKDRGLEELRAFLSSHGEAPPTDAREALSLLEDLQQRSSSIASAEQEIGRIGEDLRGRQSERDKKARQLEAIFKPLGIPSGDDEALRSLIERKPECDQWSDERKRLEHEIRELELKLESRPDLVELSSEAAEEMLEGLNEKASRFDELLDEIKGIESRITLAQGGSALAAAAAAAANAREELARRSEEALFAAAGRFLLATVEEEHEEEHQPAVLRRAQEYFGVFTRHRYQLQLESAEGDNTAVFTAWERETDQRRTLAELSDGTRVQLLLAARIAFARQTEKGAPLPLLLDEALTNSDPERFRAVARSLLLLAKEEGRQIVYLTCNPADVEHWRRICEEEGQEEPALFDLAEIRKLETAIPDASSLTAPARPEIPPPGDHPAPEYAALIGVAPPDPLAPVESLHLFHVLRHDLRRLHSLLEVGVSTLGPCRALLRAKEARGLLDEKEIAEVEAWIAVAEASLAAMRVGRGRSVDREALLSSGAVSAKYLEGFTSLAHELEGDARDLLLRVENPSSDERTKRFQSAKARQLREYLEEHGYLVEQDPLDEPAIVARVLTEVRPLVEESGIDLQAVTQRVRELLSASRR